MRRNFFSFGSSLISVGAISDRAAQKPKSTFFFSLHVKIVRLDAIDDFIPKASTCVDFEFGQMGIGQETEAVPEPFFLRPRPRRAAVGK